jgi:hypothetical protein
MQLQKNEQRQKAHVTHLKVVHAALTVKLVS